MWHVTKISGDRELRELYKEASLEYEDLFTMKVKATPFKPIHVPFLFLLMDTPYKFENALKVLWGEALVKVTGNDLVSGKLENAQRNSVL